MHKNSLEVYNALRGNGDLNRMERIVLEIFYSHRTPLRDFDCLKIHRPNSDNMNLVRPRITKLHEKGFLVEGPPQKSHYKHKNVRTSVLNLDDGLQMEMF